MQNTRKIPDREKYKGNTQHVGVLISGTSEKGESFTDIGVEAPIDALYIQVLLSLASSAAENLSAKCTSCSFNSSTPELIFEFTSPRKLGLVNSNMNSDVLEIVSIKFFLFHCSAVQCSAVKYRKSAVQCLTVPPVPRVPHISSIHPFLLLLLCIPAYRVNCIVCSKVLLYCFPNVCIVMCPAFSVKIVV